MLKVKEHEIAGNPLCDQFFEWQKKENHGKKRRSTQLPMKTFRLKERRSTQLPMKTA